jgi:hypothetical protein
MKLRFRSLAALAALFTLSVYFAEGLWASLCPPDTHAASVEAPMGHEVNGCPMALGDAPVEKPEPAETPHPGPAPCPLGPMSASGSCVAASLPAAAAAAVPPFPAGILLSSSPDAARDLLLALAVFHPPRA